MVAGVGVVFLASVMHSLAPSCVALRSRLGCGARAEVEAVAKTLTVCVYGLGPNEGGGGSFGGLAALLAYAHEGSPRMPKARSRRIVWT